MIPKNVANMKSLKKDPNFGTSQTNFNQCK